MKSAITKNARVSGKLGLVALAVSASSFAMADNAGWYAGANIGQSNSTIDNARISNGLLGSGLTMTTITNDDRDSGHKIYGGYQFNRNFALEGGYYDLGQFGFAATTLPTGTLSGNIKLRGLNFDVVGLLPLTEKFSVFGRIGANYAQASDNFSGTGAVHVLNPNPSKYDTNLKLGLGLQYALTESLAMRAEVERYRINDGLGNRGDIDLVTVGLLYRFGAKTPTSAPRAALPEPVVAAAALPPPVRVLPAPPPLQPAPVAPPPVSRTVTLSADSLFRFDQASVLSAGQQQLDQLAADLRGVSYDVITVTGHTDRIGSHAYNMKLSTRRAEAVSAYLVSSGGVPGSKIAAKGVNGAHPVTRPGDCAGKKVSKALIACLQPDRRVEIEVSGTR